MAAEKPTLSTEFDWSKPVPIIALLDMKYNIPTYQRGYRWTETQINDLLNDIQNFIDSFNGRGIGTEDFYSLQPIVVKWNKEKERWNLIDGQQRMTSIFLVVKYFECRGIYEGQNMPQIGYETREKSEVYLQGLKIDTKDPNAEPKCYDSEDKLIDNKENIDYRYMSRAFAAINKWFIEKSVGKGSLFSPIKFQEIFLYNTRVIWYELPDGEDETESFTRLNLGKIPLTNAELIKALFLNSSNFKNKQTSANEMKLEQIKIAAEWDRIENTLCNDEFWLFIHEKDYNKPNRIDFIFELIAECNALKIDLSKARLGDDEYRTFRYFSEFFWQTKNTNCDFSVTIKENWKNVKKYFQIFEEWFNNLEIYHYVGYIVALKDSAVIPDLITLWNKSTRIEDFVGKLKTYIKTEVTKTINLDQQYEIEYKNSEGNTKHYPVKTKAKKLFLLHNILTVINQNKQLEDKEEYEERVFYKFPFHIYKKEKWDVEHIDSNTENQLDKLEDQKEWIAYSFYEIDSAVENYEVLKNKVKEFMCLKDDTEEEKYNPKFTELHDMIVEQVKSEGLHDIRIKNQIGNFTLLDSNTNRAYGNALFPTKRRWIIGKDQGVKYVWKKNPEDDKGYTISEEKGEIAFVPPVTKQVFVKYYTTMPNDGLSWSIEDFEGYKQNLKRLLEEEKFI